MRSLVVLAVLLSALALSACGDDDSASDTQPQTETAASDGVSARDVAGATAKFLVVRRLLNTRRAKVDQLEAEVERANAEPERANAETKQAQAQAATATEAAADAQHQASSASDVAKAEAEQTKAAEADAKAAEAETREYAAKADAAAACARAMLEIVAAVPDAASLEDGVKEAADDLEALGPKCKASVADAGGWG